MNRLRRWMSCVCLRWNRRGFTLIEVLVALSVLSIAGLTLMVVMLNLTAQTVMPEILDTASALAEEQLERVSTLRFSEVVNEGPSPLTGDFAAYEYEINVSAVPVTLASDPGMTQFKQVEIIVRNAAAGSVNLTTVVTNN